MKRIATWILSLAVHVEETHPLQRDGRRGALHLEGLGEILLHQSNLAPRRFEEMLIAAVRPAGNERREHHRDPRGVSVSRPGMACDGESAQGCADRTVTDAPVGPGGAGATVRFKNDRRRR